MLQGQLLTFALCFAVGLGVVGSIGAFAWLGARNGIEYVTASASIRLRKMGRTLAVGGGAVSGGAAALLAYLGLLAELFRPAIICAAVLYAVSATVGGFTWRYVRGNDEYLMAASPLRIHNVGRFVAITTAPLAVASLGLMASGTLGLALMAVGLVTPGVIADRLRRRKVATEKFL